MIFNILFIIVLIFAIASFLGPKYFEDLTLVYIGVLFMVLASLGEKLGSDAVYYKEYFLGKREDYQAFEFGFLIISRIIRFFTDDPYVFFMILALISNFIFIKAAKELVPYIGMAYLLYYAKYYLPYNFQTLRQSLASGLLLLSLANYLKGNFKKYLAYILVASTFHISSLIFLVVPVLAWVNSRKRILAILTVSIILSLAVNFILNRISLGKFDVYVHGSMNLESTIITLTINIFIGLLLLLYTHDDDHLFRIWKVYFFGILIYIVFIGYGLLAFRLSRIFTIVEVFLLPQVSVKVKNKTFYVAFLALYSLAFYYRWISASPDFTFKLISSMP